MEGFRVNLTQIAMNHRRSEARQWFQIGMTAVWLPLRKNEIAETIEQQAIEFNQQIMYEQQMVTI